jgi:hypothetical protein
MLLRTYTPVAKSIARYTALGSPAEHCGICRFYAAPNICARVVGPVVPAGWCKFFSREAVFRPLAPYASGIPPGVALDLSFMTPGTIDPRIAFTRASTATYFDSTGTLQTAAVNAPRWDHDPVTHVLRGLLIEEVRSNSLFPSVNWAANATASGSVDGVAQNVGIGPSGANNAMALIPGSFNGVHQYYGVPSVTASTVYTYSVFCKAAGMNFVQLALENTGFTAQYAMFNLLAGTVDRQSANSSAVISPAGNGWYRCAITAAASATPPAVNNIYPSAVGGLAGGFPSTGDSVNGIWVWGQQLEAGAFATSFVATTAAAVTRAQDSCMIPPANMGWFTPPGGSWMAEFIGFNPPSALTPRVISYPAAGNIHTISGSTILAVQQYDGAASMVTANTFSPNTVVKAATTWAVGAARSCLNAGAIASSAALTAGYAPLATGGVRLMADETAGDGMSGYLRRMRYWPRILTNAELQSVTT